MSVPASAIADVTLGADISKIDLASLACSAALELDNLSRGRGEPTLEAVPRLATAISNLANEIHRGSSEPLHNPATLVVMNKAIADSHFSPPMKRVDDLYREAGKISDLLSSLASARPPVEADRSNLTKLRAFCVALSQLISAYQRSSEEIEPEHPYRR